MNYKSIFKHFLPILIIAFFASCDKDANEIGADILGNDNFAFGTPASFKVTAYNAEVGPVSTNNLPVNALGIYNNSVFGQTKAHFATQVQLDAENPSFGVNPVIDSVVLRVPYFSTKTEDGPPGKYELDSLFSTVQDTKIKLSVYQSGYYMRDLDPAAGERQLFYSNQNADFYNAAIAIGTRLNDALPAQNDEFAFRPVPTFKRNEADTTKLDEVAPGIKLDLNKDVFQAKFFTNAAAGQLVNNNVFKNYFRGLYFNVDQSGSETGNLALINFAGGTIDIYYKNGLPNDSDPLTAPTRIRQSFKLNLAGNSVSLLEQSNVPPAYASALQNANVISGDEKLFIKGGQGSMAVIDLFSELGDLEKLRADNLLINDASLTFTIDNQTMASGAPAPVEPQRIFLFDLNNKRPLLDYYTDQSSNSSNSKLSKLVHDGIIQKSSDGKGTKYKIRITNHIRNLVNNADSTNVKLGLVVTENIMVADNRKLKVPAGLVKYVPLMSVVHPFGTVLYGSNLPMDDPKRLKLEIYYTKPN